MREQIEEYKRQWRRRGYPIDIPDVVPAGLMHSNLAPSYKAICLAILRNDHSMTTLGFAPKPSPWYMALKRMELEATGKVEPDRQLRIRF